MSRAQPLAAAHVDRHHALLFSTLIGSLASTCFNHVLMYCRAELPQKPGTWFARTLHTIFSIYALSSVQKHIRTSSIMSYISIIVISITYIYISMSFMRFRSVRNPDPWALRDSVFGRGFSSLVVGGRSSAAEGGSWTLCLSTCCVFCYSNRHLVASEVMCFWWISGAPWMSYDCLRKPVDYTVINPLHKSAPGACTHLTANAFCRCSKWVSIPYWKRPGIWSGKPSNNRLHVVRRGGRGWLHRYTGYMRYVWTDWDLTMQIAYSCRCISREKSTVIFPVKAAGIYKHCE